MGSDKFISDNGIRVKYISIHAPPVGSDRVAPAVGGRPAQFLSTLPAWGATLASSGHLQLIMISIHAPRVGSDRKATLHSDGHGIFLSTLPAWGATVWTQCRHILKSEFLSTLPAWGATTRHGIHWKHLSISIHAPRVGSDCRTLTRQTLQSAISIHAPRVGSDHSTYATYEFKVPISIHAPRVGSDCGQYSHVRPEQAFLSTLPAWGATVNDSERAMTYTISIHAPRVGSDKRSPTLI